MKLQLRALFCAIVCVSLTQAMQRQVSQQCLPSEQEVKIKVGNFEQEYLKFANLIGDTLVKIATINEQPLRDIITRQNALIAEMDSIIKSIEINSNINNELAEPLRLFCYELKMK